MWLPCWENTLITESAACFIHDGTWNEAFCLSIFFHWFKHRCFLLRVSILHCIYIHIPYFTQVETNSKIYDDYTVSTKTMLPCHIKVKYIYNFSKWKQFPDRHFLWKGKQIRKKISPLVKKFYFYFSIFHSFLSKTSTLILEEIINSAFVPFLFVLEKLEAMMEIFFHVFYDHTIIYYFSK